MVTRSPSTDHWHANCEHWQTLGHRLGHRLDNNFINAGLNGLEAAPINQDDGNGAEWGCDGVIVSGADGLLS